MPLPHPILDDRSWDELREELVRRIPVYNPEWTDHHASDPGITLLELFAFLGENLLFRFNQIPEATRLAFLRLLDIPLRPARPARGLVRVSTRQGGGVLVESASAASAGDVPFETTTELHVWPLEATTVVRARSRSPESQEEVDFARAAVSARGGLAEREEAAYYEVRALAEDPADPEATPVDAGTAVDGMIWVAVRSTRHTDPDALGGAVLNLGFLPDPVVPSMDAVEPCLGDDTLGNPPSMIWQVSTGDMDADGQPVYRRLEVVGDGTRGLTREGVVRLRLPADPTVPRTFPATDPDLAGTGDLPPSVEDLEEDNVLFWLRVGRLRGDLPFGGVRWMGLNSVPVEQSRAASLEFLGTGDGQPGQTVSLIHRPVLDGTLSLQVDEAGRWTPWTEVEGFQASGPDDRHYTLDRDAGVVTFGDGTRGRPPQIGERIRATEYHYGGGPEGNLPAGVVKRLRDHPSLELGNLLPTRGGVAAETVEEALDRIPGELRRRDRAVTSGDFRELALQTPGLHVGRAETLPLFHPPSRNEEAAGVVTLVVWPAEDPRTPDAPSPTRAFLREVCEWLDRKRLVTTELHVVPPTYRKVAVSAGIEVKDGYGVEAVRRWVETVLRQYLAPLPPYGPEGHGWPMGRRIYGPELEAAALQVEGVGFVVEPGFRLASWEVDEDGRGSWVETDGPLELRPWEVAELVDVGVVAGPATTPGSELGPVPPGAEGPEGGEDVGPRPVPVPLPLIRERC